MLRRGAVGPDVGAVQQALLEAGHAIDRAELRGQAFGPSTHAAVLAYQGAHGLAPDGVIGPRTRAALDGVDAREGYTARGWRYDASEAEVAPVLAAAVGWIGVVEQPPGSNRGPEIDRWNARASIPLGSPWCAAWATAMYDHAPGGSPFARPLGSAYKVRAWGARARRTASTPAVGDLAVWMRTAARGHVGIVCAVLDDGRIATVEGNAGHAVRGLVRAAGDAVYVRAVAR